MKRYQVHKNSEENIVYRARAIVFLIETSFSCYFQAKQERVKVLNVTIVRASDVDGCFKTGMKNWRLPRSGKLARESREYIVYSECVFVVASLSANHQLVIFLLYRSPSLSLQWLFFVCDAIRLAKLVYNFRRCQRCLWSFAPGTVAFNNDFSQIVGIPPDPYVILRVRTSPNAKQQTSVKRHHTNPEWNESFMFYLNPKKKNTLGSFHWH